MAGFGGMRDHDGALTFAPRLPERLSRLTFGLCFRGRRLKVEVDQHQARYSLREGAPLEIAHHGEKFDITAAEPVTRTIPPAPARDSADATSGPGAGATGSGRMTAPVLSARLPVLGGRVHGNDQNSRCGDHHEAAKPRAPRTKEEAG